MDGDGRKASGELRDDLVSILQVALLFIAILVGRELGNIYSTYGEISQLSIGLEVGEEALAGFIREVLAGNDTELEVGMAFTLPSLRNVEGPVTQVPDYVRRWFISVTLSAVVVRQPEVSDVKVGLWVEGDQMLTETFPFEREKVPYLRLLKRTIALHIEDPERFRMVVQEASERYSGEVEVTLTGQVLAHITFFKVWLPFSTTRYPLVKMPHADYLSSSWTDSDGRPIRRTRVGEVAYISVRLQNPTRVHSIWENVTATIYRVGRDEPILTVQKEMGVAPATAAIYVFPFSPEKPGVYYYTLEAPGGFSLSEEESPRLEAETG